MGEAEIQGNQHYIHFGPENKLFAELESLFKGYGESGQAMTRRYLHNKEEGLASGRPAGTFTDWEPIAANTDPNPITNEEVEPGGEAGRTDSPPHPTSATISPAQGATDIDAQTPQEDPLASSRRSYPATGNTRPPSRRQSPTHRTPR